MLVAVAFLRSLVIHRLSNQREAINREIADLLNSVAFDLAQFVQEAINLRLNVWVAFYIRLAIDEQYRFKKAAQVKIVCASNGIKFEKC